MPERAAGNELEDVKRTEGALDPVVEGLRDKFSKAIQEVRTVAGANRGCISIRALDRIALKYGVLGRILLEVIRDLHGNRFAYDIIDGELVVTLKGKLDNGT